MFVVHIHTLYRPQYCVVHDTSILNAGITCYDFVLYQKSHSDMCFTGGVFETNIKLTKKIQLYGKYQAELINFCKSLRALASILS